MKTLRRTVLLFLALFMLGITAHSQVITAERAQEIAEEFFAQGFTRTRSVAPSLEKVWDSSVLTAGVQTRSVVSEDPTFHTFAGADGKGFVIVAGQETGTQIIGYSMDGTLPAADDMPEGMIDYLTDIDNQIRAVRESGTIYTMTRAAATATQYGTPVVELNTYPLSQGSPYNSVCSEKLGYSVVTGCVPTAFAMVMLHHRWPNTITKRIGYSTDGATVQYINVADVTYDWANMFDTNGTLTTEGNNQVANMMFHLGAAYGVTWGSSSTDGQPNAYRMNDYFGYNYTNYSSGSSGMTNRGTAGDDNWVTYIKESLDAGYPIPYQATNSGSGSDAKHIFILDGYTNNDYYHFNWGWGGSGNGYYTLNNMAPTSSDEYAGGGIANHNAVFMLRPNRGDVTVTASSNLATAGTATVNGEASVTIADGSQVTLVAEAYSGYSFLNWTLNGNVVSTSATYTPYVNGASDYVANFAANDQLCTVTVVSNGGGSVSIDGASGTTLTVEKGSEVTVNATPDSGYLFSKWEQGTSVASESASYTFTANSDITLNATFIPTVTVTVGYEGVGSVSIDGASGTSYEVAQGTTVTVRATETGVYEFEGWYNGTSKVSSDAVYTFTANSNVSIVAKFIYTSGTNEVVGYEISTATGKFYNKNGTAITSGWAASFTYTVNNNNKAEVVITAKHTSNGVSAANINLGEFALYTGANGSCTYTITVPSPYTIESYSFNYVENADVTITSNDASSTNLLADGLFRVTGLNSSSASFVLTASGDKGLSISNFVVNVIEPSSGEGGGETTETYTISATSDTNGSVTINGSAVSSTTVNAGSTVTMVATPNAGYQFDGWYSGTELVSSDATYTFTASANVSLTAEFSKIPTTKYTVSVAVNTGGSVTINGSAVTSASVDAGSTVELAATPDTGYKFDGWYSGGTSMTLVSSEATYSFTASADVSLTAVFSVEENGGDGGDGGGTGGGDVTVDYTPSVTGARSESSHYVTSIAVTDNETYTLTTTERAQYYVDKTAEKTFTVEAGSEMQITLSRGGESNWANAYAYIDYDGDGFTAGIADDNYTPTGDLVSYSFYNTGTGDATGYNSAGTYFGNDKSRNNRDLPAFTAPTEPGTYRMRVKYDWCSIDPAGGNADGNRGALFSSLSGTIIDFTLVVEGDDVVDPTPDPEELAVVSVKQNLNGIDDDSYIDGILIEFNQAITVDWGVSEGTGTGTGTDAGTGTSVLRIKGVGDVSSVTGSMWTNNATIVNETTLCLPLETNTVINRTGTYTLEFPAGVVSTAGGSEYAGETFTFTVDAAPVRISQSYPDFSNQFTTLDVKFYEEIAFADGSSTASLSVYVYNTSNLAGTINATISGKVLTLTMDEALAPASSTKYSISIPNGLIARADNLDKVFKGATFSFYVEVPVTITDITPVSGSVVEELNSIAVTYSREVSLYALNSVQLVNTADASTIALTGSVSGNVLTLTPSVAVPAGTYTLSGLTGAVYDNLDGGQIEEEPDYTITVEEALQPLTVVSVTPDAAVTSLETITVTYSDAISGKFEATSMVTPIYINSKSNGCSFEVSGNVLTITLNSAITEPGTYALYIPQGNITRAADGSDVVMNGEYTFTVEEAAVEPEPEVETTAYIVDANGLFTRWNSGSETGGSATGWNYKWSYNTSVSHPAALTMTETKYKKNNISSSGSNIIIAAGDQSAAIYMLSVPAPYKIKSYSFDAQSALHANTIAPSVGMGVGQQITTTTTGTTHFSVTDVNARSASFTVNGQNNNIICTNFIVEVYVDYGNAIYTLETSRGFLFYDSSVKDGYLASTVRNATYTAGSDVASCQWIIYTSPNSSRNYIYNVGGAKFIGMETANNARIPVVTEVTNPIYIYNSTKAGYPFVFSTDNYGAINHSSNHYEGIVNWRGDATSGGLRSLADDGSAHRLNYVGEADDATIAIIAAAVETYETANKVSDETIASIREQVNSWPLQLGYPTEDSREAYLSKLDDVYLQHELDEIEDDLFADIILPENGKAYIIKNVQQGGTEYYFKHTATALTTTSSVTEATPYICRVLDNGKVVFVNNDGKYLVWRPKNGVTDGADSSHPGYVDEYSSEWCDLQVRAFVKNSFVQTDLFSLAGYVNIYGKRSDSKTGCFIVSSGGAFDTSEAPYYSASYSSALILTEVEYANVVTLNSIAGSSLISGFEEDGLATFSAPFPTVLPEGVTAYYAANNNSEYVSLTEYTGAALPANEGFILSGAVDSYTMIPAAGESTAALATTNALGHSAGADITLTSGQCYLLGDGSEGPGFYACGAGTLKMNKAYLNIPATASRSIVIRFPGTTDIDDALVGGNGNDAIYDLTGRKIDEITVPGIYIINGKKVLVK